MESPGVLLRGFPYLWNPNKELCEQKQASRSKIMGMAIVRFPALMKYYVDNQSEFVAAGSTVHELTDNVLARYPALKPHLLDSEGNLRRHFNIFVNGTHIRELNGMETELNEDDKVILMASAAGG